MITLRYRSTRELFDPWEFLGVKRRRLLDRCWAGVFRKHLLEQLPAATLADKFVDSFGHPSKDLHAVPGALVLQQLHDLTDSATVETMAFNMAWHYGLDIQNTSDSYVCKRTLINAPIANGVLGSRTGMAARLSGGNTRPLALHSIGAD